MTKEREALKLALEALEWNLPVIEDWGGEGAVNLQHKAIAAIYEALAQPEQEPVAWGFQNTAITGSNRWMMLREEIPANDQYGGALWTPLYTTPPQRKPLTDVEIWNTYKNLWMFHPAEEPRLAGDVLKFARAIEAAHGIKD